MQKTRGITTIGMTAVLLWGCGTAVAVQHCGAHGVSVTDEVLKGDPIQADVTFDLVPANGTKPADLGSRKVGDKIAIAVTLWDTDNHVCKVEPKNQTVKAAMKSQDLTAQAYTVDSNGNNKTPVGNPVDVKVTGTDTDKKLSLAGTIEVGSAWAGNYILICLQGKAEDEYCSAHQSATDTPLEMYNFTAKLIVLNVETETLATVPTDRTRKKVGVGERVALTLQPASLSAVSWSISGNGTLSATSGNPVTFTAYDRASTASITAIHGGTSTSVAKTSDSVAGSSATVTFDVVEPTGQIIERKPGTGIWHVQGIPSVGFKGCPYIQPEDVSFENIDVRERDVAAVCTGYFAYQNGDHHGDKKWRQVGAVVAGKGSQVLGVDKIQGICDNHTPYEDGTFTWAIPLEFKVGKGAAKQFTPVNQVKTIDKTGKMTISKGGTIVSKELNDPDSDY